MTYSITGYLEKYYGCVMSKENITLNEAFSIAWSNAQKGLHSVIESDIYVINIDRNFFDRYTTYNDIEQLLEDWQEVKPW